jgi:hypothetical protein
MRQYRVAFSHNPQRFTFPNVRLASTEVRCNSSRCRMRAARSNIGCDKDADHLIIATVALPRRVRCRIHDDASSNHNVASPQPRCSIEDLGLHDRLVTASDARHSRPDLPCTMSLELIRVAASRRRAAASSRRSAASSDHSFAVSVHSGCVVSSLGRVVSRGDRLEPTGCLILRSRCAVPRPRYRLATMYSTDTVHASMPRRRRRSDRLNERLDPAPLHARSAPRCARCPRSLPARCRLAVSLAGIREAIAGTGARYPLVLPPIK